MMTSGAFEVRCEFEIRRRERSRGHDFDFIRTGGAPDQQDDGGNSPDGF
jgi:hypothetical protein